MSDEIRIFSLGDTALTVEFGNAISVELNQRAIALARHFEVHPFSGFIEAIPAYASTTIVFDPIKARRLMAGTAFKSVSAMAEKAIAELAIDTDGSSRLVEIPMMVDEESSPDLGFVADQSGLTTDEVLRIFLAREYRVYMLGFLPGFSYMGDVDDRIATPRRETPRTQVPKGSIGIAGKQTGIYSLASPGGWQLIGRAAGETFTPADETPSLLQPGDRVRFFIAE